MKKLYVLGIALFLCSLTSQANIWRVNNQSTSTAVFTTVQAAIDSDLVSNGDTILIEGSAQTYTGFDLDKRLVIIGTGYFLSQNPKTSIEGITAVVSGQVDFVSGSEGSVLSSIEFSHSTIASPRVYANNILITNCYFGYEVYIGSDISGLLLTENYFASQGIEYSTIASFQGTVLKNNIINSDFYVVSDSDDPRTFAAVENNLFLGSVNLSTSSYRNNIWLPLQSETISVNAGIKEYNVNISVDMGAENNNSLITGLTELYTGEGSTDGKWQIKADSEFKGAGKDGTDPGPFGGSNPYVLSGLPALPIIYEISTTGFGSTQDGLPLTIKVRAN